MEKYLRTVDEPSLLVHKNTLQTPNAGPTFRIVSPCQRVMIFMDWVKSLF